MDIKSRIKSATASIKYTWNDDPLLIVLVVVILAFFSLFSWAMYQASVHEQRDWTRECAQMRPLVECREDAATLFGGSE